MKTRITTLVAVLVLPVGIAKAEPQGQSQSPFWDQEQSPTAQFPTDLAAKVAPAAGSVAGLEVLHRQADQRVEAREAEVERQNQPAVREALQTLRDAIAAEAAARKQALEALSDDQDYLAAGELADQISDRLQGDNSLSKSESSRLAREALHYETLQSADEREVLQESEPYQEAVLATREARQAYYDALAAVEVAVARDAEAAALRAEAAALQAQLAAARAEAQATARAANLALAFARQQLAATQQDRFDQVRYDPYRYGYGFSPFFNNGFFVRPVITTGNFRLIHQPRRPIPTITNVQTNF
jgi:hypothetical protein